MAREEWVVICHLFAMYVNAILLMLCALVSVSLCVIRVHADRSAGVYVGVFGAVLQCQCRRRRREGDDTQGAIT